MQVFEKKKLSIWIFKLFRATCLSPDGEIKQIAFLNIQFFKFMTREFAVFQNLIGARKF